MPRLIRSFPLFSGATLALGAVLTVSSASRAQAPITLTAATYPASSQTTELFWRGDNPAGAPIPRVGANQVWDYSALPLEPTGVLYANFFMPVPAGSPFSGAGLRQVVTQLYAGSLELAGTNYQRVDATGVFDLGYGLDTYRQSLTATTGGATDSLVVPRQVIPNQPAARVLPFPFTAATGNRCATRTRFAAQLTVAALGLNRAPFYWVRRYIRTDSGAAWGTLRVPVRQGASLVTSPSAPLPVLMRRTTLVVQDSFYLGNQPAPANLLAGLQLTQGGVSRTYRDDFLRAGSGQYVLRLGYDDPARTALTFSWISAEANVPLRAPALVQTADATLWPNPVAAGQALQLTISGLTQPVAATLPVTLHDALGRVVLTTKLRPDVGTLSLPATLAPGAYLLLADLPDGRALRRRVVVE